MYLPIMHETERLLKSFINALDSFKAALDKYAEAIRENENSNRNAGNNKPIQPLLVEISAASQLDPARSEYYVAENRERDSFWRKLKPWVETIGVSVGIILVSLTCGTLQQVKRQADIAEADNRPWLKITAVKLDPPPTLPVLHFVTRGGIPGMNLAVEFIVKNIGKGVAQDVFITPNVIFTRWNETDASKRTRDQQFACEQWRTEKFPGPFTWSAVFPGDQVKFRVGILGRYREDIASKVPDHIGKFVVAALFGCVTYQYPRGYQTRAIFDIMGDRDRLLEVGKDLDEPHVHLLRDEHYEHAQ